MIKTKSEVMKDSGKVLNKRITIQRFIPTQNKNGFDVSEWIEYKPVWASVNNLWGKEFYAAKAVQAENTVEFTVRYSKDLEVLLKEDGTRSYRVYWNKRAFDITFADNIQYANEWIKIKTVEI